MNELLVKHFSKETSQAEEQEILLWRAASAENARTYIEAKEVWLFTQSNTPKAPEDVLASILSPAGNTQPSFISQYWMPMAASIALVLVAAVWFFLSGVGESSNLPPMASLHKLEDGSTITLYEGSSYEVKTMDDETRSIELKGKAFFDIKRDERRPFLIYTSDIRVKVLGTSFVVDAATPDATEVLVASGKVAMSKIANPQRTSSEIFLEKGEKGVLPKDAAYILKQKIRDENFMAWSNGIITFRTKKLEDVAKTLKSVYGITVDFDNQELARCLLTAKFQNRPVEEVIEIIAATFNIQYQTDDESIVLIGKGC